MNPTVPVWGVDIADRQITAARVQRTPDGALELLSWWTAPVVGDTPPVAAAIDALRRRRLQDHGLILVLPGRSAVCRTFRVAAEDADLPPPQLGRELEDFTTFEGAEAALRYRRLGDSSSLDFLVAAERTAPLQQALEAIKNAGFPYCGVALEPAAVLDGLDLLHPGGGRGFHFRMHGRWSALLARDGAQVVRYVFPLGIDDVEEGVRQRDSALEFSAVLGAAPGTALADRAGRVLTGSMERLCADLRRLVDFHRCVLKGSGEEQMEFYGPRSDQAGLRWALTQGAPVPLAPLRAADATGALRPGPGVRSDAILRVLPVLLPCIGAAVAALGAVPADLHFAAPPTELPVPRERSLFGTAAAVLVAGAAASVLLSMDLSSAMASSTPPVEAIRLDPAPLDRVGRDASAAFRKSALSEALAAVARAAPDSGDPVATRSLLDFRITREDRLFRAEIVVRFEGVFDADGALDAVAALPAVAPLIRDGWAPAELAGRGELRLRRTFPDETVETTR